MVKEIIEDTTPLIFKESEIEKHLTKAEADILYILNEKMYKAKTKLGYSLPIAMEDKITERIKDICDYKVSYIVRFDYNDVTVTEVEDIRQTGGEPFVDIFDTYKKV